MSERHRLRQLLRNPQIWRAARTPVIFRQMLPTGFADLDQALAGGWPLGVLVELLVDVYGVGELRLLMPALTALSNDQTSVRSGVKKWIMLVAPPYIPYAPALVQQGMNTSRLLLVQGRHQAEILWAMEQALHSSACVAVLAWLSVSDERALRRLQLAAEKRRCWVVLFRPSRFKSQRSPAALRIHLRPARASGISLNILKRRGGQPAKLIINT